MESGNDSARRIGRRQFLIATIGSAALASCARGDRASPSGTTVITPSASEVIEAERLRRRNGARIRDFELRATTSEIDLGGIVVTTWAYDNLVPGPLLRMQAGEVASVRVTNELSDPTSVHWHGLVLRNDMDGVPGVTQHEIEPGQRFEYEFAVPEAGTYWFHPHSGLQLDRGLYGAFIVDDPDDLGAYDDEWVVVLDDWLDGTGTTPETVFAALAQGMGGQGMGGHGMGGEDGAPMTRSSPLLGGDAGDVDYPYYLLNGRVTTAPEERSIRRGSRLRLRVINAASDTAFRVALQGHRLRVTHNDGRPIRPVDVEAVLVGMGERFDALVEVGDGAFALDASAEGKGSFARGVLRSSDGDVPVSDQAQGREPILLARTMPLAPTSVREPDRVFTALLGGDMMDYVWTINGRRFEDTEPFNVEIGERVRLRLRNRSMMWHPMHLHGHVFDVRGGSAKDTVAVLPSETVDIDFDADNPGQWMLHCHNGYHLEGGMMGQVNYVRAKRP